MRTNSQYADWARAIGLLIVFLLIGAQSALAERVKDLARLRGDIGSRQSPCRRVDAGGAADADERAGLGDVAVWPNRRHRAFGR